MGDSDSDAALAEPSESVSGPPPYLEMVPDDILVRVVGFFDAYTMDRIARVSSHFVQRTRESLWWNSTAVRLTKRWFHVSMMKDIDEYRNYSLGLVRPREDGVYICQCKYWRKIGRGHSVTDSRTIIPIVYYRLIRIVGSEVRMLTWEGDIRVAVEALKSEVGEGQPAADRRIFVGSYNFDCGEKLVHTRYQDAKYDYHITFELSKTHSKAKLAWQNYIYRIKGDDTDQGSEIRLVKEHFGPLVFRRSRDLEYLF